MNHFNGGNLAINGLIQIQVRAANRKLESGGDGKRRARRREKTEELREGGQNGEGKGGRTLIICPVTTK